MSGVGHLGELRTIDYFRKTLAAEIYLPLRDSGVDFVAGRRGNFVQVQVKTSMYQKKSYFWFDVHRQKLRNTHNMYFVFVCYTLGRRRFMGKSHNFLVVPVACLHDWIAAKKMSPKQGDPDCINVFVYPENSNGTPVWKYRNKGSEIDLTGYWNAFDPVADLLQR